MDSVQCAGPVKLLVFNADWLADALFITSITSDSRLFIYLFTFSLASPTISEGPDQTHHITVLEASVLVNSVQTF